MPARTLPTLLAILAIAAVLGLLVLQLAYLPAEAERQAAENPGVAYLREPCLVVAILVLACGQLALLASAACCMLTATGRSIRARIALVYLAMAAIIVGGALCLALGVWIQATAGQSPASAGCYFLAIACFSLAVGVLVFRILFLSRGRRRIEPATA